MSHFALIRGSSSLDLGSEVARSLDHPISPSHTEVFPDGEIAVRLDEAVRGGRVFVIQSTAPPVTNHVFELLLYADACRRAGADAVVAVMPYFGYARADKRHARRESVAASMVAHLLESAGVTHVVAIDLHAPQIEGFFQIPLEHLTAVPALCDVLRGVLPPETVVVSPSEGRIHLAGKYAQRLGLGMAVIHKKRVGGLESRTLQIAGEVKDKPCLIVDDMITTGGTVAHAMAALIQAGARPEIWVAATHGVLVDGARTTLMRPALRGLFVTDTVAPHEFNWPELTVVSIAPLVAGAVQRLAAQQSINDLFD